MNGNDIQVIAKMLTDALITEFEYQRLVDIEDSGERVAATIEVLHTKQNMISAKEHLKELSNLTEEVVTDPPDVIEDVIKENAVMPIQVLLLTTVLNCLFRYLDVGDLKSGKGVCRKWREVAEVNLRKRTAATIIFLDKTSLLTFMAYYANCLPCKPFTSFSFSSDNNNYYNDNLENFFRKFGKTIKQLAIVPPGVRYPPFKFDFGPFLRPSIITKLHLKSSVDKQELCHSLARFSSLKYLYATNYILHIEGLEKKLSLVDLYLDGVGFHRGNQHVPHLLINEVFEFRNAENITLEPDQNTCTTQLSIDMSNEISNARNFVFTDVTCINWTGCYWKIDRFEFCGVDFTEPHQARIKKMHFWACGMARIDLALLSDCIEELVLEYSDYSDVLCSRPIIIPHLNKLRLCVYDWSATSSNVFNNVIRHFMLCENLLELELVDVRCTKLYNLYTVVPPSVRKMYVSDFIIILNANLNLQKLVIDNYEIEDIEMKILPWVNAEEVILRLEEVGSFQEFDRVFNLMLAKYDKIFLYIGQEVNLSTYGDLKGNNYYAFKNQMGVEITKEEFDVAALLRPNL